jgi:hypothetical protein
MIRTTSSTSPCTLQKTFSPGCYQLAHTAVLYETLTSELLKVKFSVFGELPQLCLSVHQIIFDLP